jgi:hypothetical protein
MRAPHSTRCGNSLMNTTQALVTPLLAPYATAATILATATRNTWQVLRSVGPLGRSLTIAPSTSTARSQSCSRSRVGWLSSPASIPSKLAGPLVASTRPNGPPKPTLWPYASTDRYSPSMAALPCPRSMNGSKIPPATLRPIASLLSPTMQSPSTPTRYRPSSTALEI